MLPLCFLSVFAFFFVCVCVCGCVLMWSSSSKTGGFIYGFMMVKGCVQNGAVSLCFYVCKSAFLDLNSCQTLWELFALCWARVLETGAPTTWVLSGHNCFRWTLKSLDSNDRV